MTKTEYACNLFTVEQGNTADGIMRPRASYYRSYDEIIAKKDSATLLVNTSDWIRVCKITDRQRLDSFPGVLHLGEREAMLLYDDINADLIIIDDNNARKEAARRGQKVTGILGILSRAKNEGLIDRVKPLISELLDNGYFISENVLDYLYQSLNE